MMNIRKALLLFIFINLAACDYEVPLSVSPKMVIDKQVIGLWEQTKEDGKKQNLLILPLNEHEYMLVWPKGNTSELYAKAHLFKFDDKTLVQLEWFGNSDGGVPDDNRIYQIGRYTIEDGMLETQLLNVNVTGKNFSSSSELAEAIKRNNKTPSLFNEKIVYKKIKQE